MRKVLVLFAAVIAFAVGCLSAPRSREEVAVAREAIAASVWTLAPNSGLGARTSAAIAYDESRGVTVMFGGTSFLTTNLDMLPTTPLADTREWNGQTWSIPPARKDEPPARVNAAMSYDAKAKVVLLYGGRAGKSVHADMWSYDGLRWTKLCDPCAPGPREAHGMAFDSKRNVTMLVGGTDQYWADPGAAAYAQRFANASMTSTWSWDGVAWTERCPNRACADEPYSVGGALVYDVKRDRMLYVGGRPWEWYCTGYLPTGGSCDTPDDTHGVPNTVRELAVDADGVARWSVLCQTDVSKYAGPSGVPLAGRSCGARWDQRVSAAVVYDPIRERVVVVGGMTREPAADGVGKSRGDVLELVFTGGKAEWRSLCPATNSECGPPRRHNAAAVFESNRSQMLLAGGARSELTGIAYDDTWTMRVRGEPCTANAACNGGHCVDGVCCAVAACNTCETCSAPGREGACTTIRGADDEDSCHGTKTCAAVPRKGADGGLHDCVGRSGTACTEPADCEKGFCVDGVCCETRCDQPCETCSAARGAPRDGTCGNVRAGDRGLPACLGRRCTGGSNTCEPDAPCASDEDCEDDHYCAVASKRCKQRIDCVKCAPYRCGPSGDCNTRCESVDDCADGFVCDSNHRCAAPPGGSETACSVTRVGAGGDAFGVLVATLVVLARRRRERAR